MEDEPKVCSNCNAKIQTGSKFCKECGNPIEETPEEVEVHQSPIKCPNCNVELKPEDKFCTECGTKIEPVTTCPKCNAEVKSGTRFCTECGVNVYEYQPPKSTIQTGTKITDVPQGTSTTRTSAAKEEDPMEDLKETGMNIMQDVEKTGRGLMKDLGGFLDKSSKKSSKNTIKPAKKNQKFLVCDQCGGYYQLQNGESPEDFSLECDCGGHLEVKNKHP